MSIATISPRELATRLGNGTRLDLIDVRTAVEYAEVHATGARHIPLDRLDAAHVLAERRGTDDHPVCLICKSGARAAKAAQKFIDAGFNDVVSVEGGTDAWLEAGLPVERQRGVISLERQVRIAAGALVLAGVVMGATMNAWLYAISGFVGAGLVFAGVTNTCGMGLFLARMPWNRHHVVTCAR